MFRNLFQGRYGIDQFSLFLLIFAAFFFYISILWIVGILIIAYVIFRSFSQNIPARKRELWAFNGVLMKFVAFFRKNFAFIPHFFKWLSKKNSTSQMKWRQRKQYVFPHCPKCHKTLRLPRGKGMLMVKCTVCGHEFKKRT